MSDVKVKNSKRQDNEGKCPGGKSWIDHWKNVFGIRPITCAKKDCKGNKDLVGGHVYKIEDSTKKLFIVPLCHEHNSDNFTEEFEVSELKLVPITKCDKCKEEKK